MIPTDWNPPHPAFRKLLERFAHAASPLYLVGGTVRDYLFKRTQPEITVESNRSHLDAPDVDLVVERNAIRVARRMGDQAGWAFYPLDVERDVARLVYKTDDSKTDDSGQLICDVTGLQGRTIREDLLARDFTVNAMALEYTPDRGSPRLLDPCGGQRDLQARTLRRVTDRSLPDDPVRLLRAVRLAAQFDFSIEPATRAQIAQLAGRIREASPERIRDELWKALATQHPDQVIDELRELGLLEHLLPELTATMGVTQSPPHHLDVYHHTLLVMKHAAYLRDRLLTTADESAAPGGATTAQRIERDALAPLWPALVHHFRQRLGAERRRAQWLVWHALFHDVGKPRTRTVESTDGGVRIRFLRHEQEGAQMTADRLAALRVSRREISLAESVVRCHMRPHSLHDSFASGRISRRALYRFYRDCDGQPARPTGVDVALLALADYRAIHRALLDAEPAPDALAAWRDYADHVRQLLEFGLASDGWAAIRQEPLVNGHVLMEALDLQPGPELGRLLERLAEAQAAGEIQTPEDALQWAAHWLAEHSTDPDAANATVYASESG